MQRAPGAVDTLADVARGRRRRVDTADRPVEADGGWWCVDLNPSHARVRQSAHAVDYRRFFKPGPATGRAGVRVEGTAPVEARGAVVRERGHAPRRATEAVPLRAVAAGTWATGDGLRDRGVLTAARRPQRPWAAPRERPRVAARPRSGNHRRRSRRHVPLPGAPGDAGCLGRFIVVSGSVRPARLIRSDCSTSIGTRSEVLARRRVCRRCQELVDATGRPTWPGPAPPVVFSSIMGSTRTSGWPAPTGSDGPRCSSPRSLTEPDPTGRHGTTNRIIRRPCPSLRDNKPSGKPIG